MGEETAFVLAALSLCLSEIMFTTVQKFHGECFKAGGMSPFLISLAQSREQED